MSKFAFVYWIGDPEPKCWQVISTNAIKAKDPIREGETYDAEWKVNEETSPAKVIKLGDNKAYLKQYMNHEYVEKWNKEKKKPLNEKRKTKPKELPKEYVKDGTELQSDSDNETKLTSLASLCSTMPANKPIKSDTKKAKKAKKDEELRLVREKNTELTRTILTNQDTVNLACSQSPPATVTEARELQKQKIHPQFGGKCPKDIHKECKATIEALKTEINELKSKLKEKSSSSSEINTSKLPDDIPQYGKIPRSVGVALNWKEISPGIWMDSMALNACLRSCISKTHFARTLLEKFVPDIRGKRLHEIDGDIVEAIVDLSLMSKFKKNEKEDTRGSIKQSLRKKCNQYIFQAKRPEYFKDKQKERRASAKRKREDQEGEKICDSTSDLSETDESNLLPNFEF